MPRLVISAATWRMSVAIGPTSAAKVSAFRATPAVAAVVSRGAPPRQPPSFTPRAFAAANATLVRRLIALARSNQHASWYE
jgi:hypothetical protein